MYPVVKCSAGDVSEECTFTELLLLSNGIHITIGEYTVSTGVSIRARILTI